MKSCRLSISNYKITVHVSSPLSYGKIKLDKPFLESEKKKKYWIFTVYKHKIPSKSVNVTGIRNLVQEWKLIKKVIRKQYQVKIEKMEINNIFATQNLTKHKLSYNMKRIQDLGRQQYGQNFMFYLEPEISAALHVKSREKPTISLMCYATGSACVFLTHVHQLYLVQKMLDQFYAQTNLKQICN